jgi:hypothetical protein
LGVPPARAHVRSPAARQRSVKSVESARTLQRPLAPQPPACETVADYSTGDNFNVDTLPMPAPLGRWLGNLRALGVTGVEPPLRGRVQHGEPLGSGAAPASSESFSLPARAARIIAEEANGLTCPPTFLQLALL